MPVAYPPAMCWIYGEGFTRNGAFYQHCTDAHGVYAEYRKRLVASTAGRLQAFVALGKAAHVAVCRLALDVLGAWLVLSALGSSRRSRGRYHEVRGGLRHMRAEGLVREPVSCISLAGGDGQEDLH